MVITSLNEKKITSSKLIILVSIFLMLFGNITFFSNVLEVYPFSIKNGLFILSLAIVFGCFIIILLSLVCYKYTLKPVLITVLLVSSSTAYFMDTYNVIIDHVMIDNIIQTNTAESLDLLSVKQFIYFLLLGLIPSILIYKTKVTFLPAKNAAISRVKLIVFSFVIAILTILVFGNFYASFFREHKPLRFYANPSYYIYSTGKYIGEFFESESTPLKSIGLDATIKPSGKPRNLIIFIVGETARTDHLSLNGYNKQTNPLLKKEEVISFKNTWACGTSTAVSVPCMFSVYGRSDYSKSKAENTENVLDILQRAGVNVLWLDNNSDSKGVASRVPFENYKTADKNSVCDIECRDTGMLKELDTYIEQKTEGDIFIILHQMGNHGPAYYKRYPLEFEKFTPTCKTNQLEQCSREEISNTYDNALLYTDYFLSEVITLLKQYNEQFETMMFYVSDHGESLGENNLYLHGLPYMIAPDAQKQVPMIMWFGDNKNIKVAALHKKVNNKYTHDNLFHTLLGLMEVNTEVYDKSMDILSTP